MTPFHFMLLLIVAAAQLQQENLFAQGPSISPHWCHERNPAKAATLHAAEIMLQISIFAQISTIFYWKILYFRTWGIRVVFLVLVPMKADGIPVPRFTAAGVTHCGQDMRINFIKHSFNGTKKALFHCNQDLARSGRRLQRPPAVQLYCKM